MQQVMQVRTVKMAAEQERTLSKREIDELIIEAVRQFPCLYDPTSKKYRDIIHTTTVWEEVAASVGRDPGFCKERWRKVRDSYVKVKKNCTARNANTSWAHYEAMDFLSEHIKHRTSVSRETDDTVATHDNARASDGADSKVRIEYQLDDGNFQALPEGTNHAGSRFSPRRLILQSDAGGSPKIKRLCRRVDPLEVGPTSQASADTDGFDEESLFGKMVAATLRRFTPHAKAVCKFKIQEIIFEMENEALKNPPHQAQPELRIEEEQS